MDQDLIIGDFQQGVDFLVHSLNHFVPRCLQFRAKANQSTPLSQFVQFSPAEAFLSSEFAVRFSGLPFCGKGLTIKRH